MLQATNPAYLDPQENIQASSTTGWHNFTAYAGADFITDGYSLVKATEISAADRQRLTARLGQPWPFPGTRPTQQRVVDIVDQALAAAHTPVEFLGVAGDQAFLLTGHQVTDQAANLHEPATGQPLQAEFVNPVDLCATATVPAARLAYLVKLTDADRLTVTEGTYTLMFLLWRGKVFVGLLAHGALRQRSHSSA